jgi:hypothetical protein
MKSDLAIAALIRSRMTEVGLSRGEFAKRLGYKNIAKGIRTGSAAVEGPTSVRVFIVMVGLTRMLYA